MADDEHWDVLSAGCGRGSTALSTVMDAALLQRLAQIVGATGLVIAASDPPLSGSAWAAVRCHAGIAVPLRSHCVDAAVIQAGPELDRVAEEVRRALVPRGDVRVKLTNGEGAERAAVEAALRSANIIARHWFEGRASVVLAARGP